MKVRIFCIIFFSIGFIIVQLSKHYSCRDASSSVKNKGLKLYKRLEIKGFIVSYIAESVKNCIEKVQQENRELTQVKKNELSP